MGFFDFLRKKPAPESPGRFGMDELARRMGLDATVLTGVKPAYHAFTVPKRSGDGVRQILAPAPDLKHLQRLILRRLLGRLAVHPAVHGFEPGRSIVTNALPHARALVVLKLDVKDFFTSTKAHRIESYLRFIGWNGEAAAVLTRLCTHDDGLPQGAPTSPRLSNLVNVRLDARLAGLAGAQGAVYTRYADDLTFSFHDPERAAHRHVNAIIPVAKQVLRDDGYMMHLRGKLQIRRSHDQMRVTGLVVNETVQLPRDTRRRLRAMKHRIARGQAATISAQQLQGWESLEQMIVQQRDAAGGEPV